MIMFLLYGCFLLQVAGHLSRSPAYISSSPYSSYVFDVRGAFRLQRHPTSCKHMSTFSGIVRDRRISCIKAGRRVQVKKRSSPSPA